LIRIKIEENGQPFDGINNSEIGYFLR